MDFEKAFDSVNRKILCEKLLNMDVKGKTYNLIRKVLQTNFIIVDNGKELSNPIPQKKGILQGDTLSSTLFLVYVRDLPEKLKETGAKCIMYADDLAIYSQKIEHIQAALNMLQIWCTENKLNINTAKTKIMKFRKGGPLRKTDVVKYGHLEIEFVNSYEYLGVTLQTTLTWTKHFENKRKKTAHTIGALDYLAKLTLTTAEKVFNIKIWPALTYAIRAIIPTINTQHLITLDKIKAQFYKKTLGLPKNTSNTFVFQLAATNRMGKDLIETFFNTPEATKIEYKNSTNEKGWKFVVDSYTDGPAFYTESWKKANQKDRHILTATTWHGYHHFICQKDHFHYPIENCVCRLCNKHANRYHILLCEGLNGPIKNRVTGAAAIKHL